MKYMNMYAIKYDVELKKMESLKKRKINLSKNTKNIMLDYEDLIKRYLNDEIEKKVISRLDFSKVLSNIDDTLLTEFFLKYYSIEPLSIEELNRSIETIAKSLEILYRNLNLLNEYGNDIDKNEENIRKINTDIDDSLSDEFKKYIKKYYISKVKSIKTTINYYTDILNILKQTRENILNNELKNVDNLKIKNISGNSYVPFNEFYYNRIKKLLKLQKRVKNLNTRNDRITNINENILKRLLCEDCSLKFNNELEELEKVNQKRETLNSDEDIIIEKMNVKVKNLNMSQNN